MDGVKAAVVLFVCAIVQVAVLTEYAAFRTASIVLVALLSIALLRGSVFGAVAGFGTGLLLDTATLGTLGVTSLLLTVAGFWIGRYGETTARDRFHAPFLSVAVVTVLFAFGQVLLQFMLGEPAPAGLVAHGAAGRPAPQPGADAARLRARPPAVPAASARRPHRRGAAAWLARTPPAGASSPATRASRSRTG